jgi:hypothetical protein
MSASPNKYPIPKLDAPSPKVNTFAKTDAFCSASGASECPNRILSAGIFIHVSLPVITPSHPQYLHY